jgi:hypothetical protein
VTRYTVANASYDNGISIGIDVLNPFKDRVISQFDIWLIDENGDRIVSL